MTIATIVNYVQQFIGLVGSMFGSFDDYWFVFLPISFSIFSFVFSKLRQLLMFRRRR